MTPRSLDGVSVALTRPAGRNEPLAALLAAAGATVVVVPLIEIGPADDAGALGRALSSLDEVTWVAVTSASAVPAILGAVDDVRALERCRVAAVGPATAEALREASVRVDVVGDGSGGSRLADLLGRPGPGGGAVVIAAAAEPRPELGAALSAAGWSVDQAPAYATRPVAPGETEAGAVLGADVVIVASPSAVRSLVQLASVAARETSEVRLVAIGATTATKARRAGFADVTVAARPSDQGLFDAVVDSVRRGPARA